ncbi:MAG: RNA 2'-phosphotransferase [Lachnospiraceae bacterium]|nr:RNA 2'-phosphotransferase [Lachnospiraceae bacterium]
MQKKKPDHLLSKILRHNPDLVGITLDCAGWADTDTLFYAIQKNNPSYTMEAFEHAILSNERYSFSDESHTKVRADYGHSIGLRLEDLCGSPSTPPDILYHGTERDVKDSILASGIHRQTRDHVFLTDDPNVAMKKAMRRHTPPAIIVVDAKKMAEDGYALYHAKNDIWLAYDIPKEYILSVKDWV